MTISLIRTLILYCLVIFAIRIMGKRQIGEMQASELVVTLMISDLATLPMQEVGIPMLYGVIPILALVFIEVILSYLMLKFPGIRKIISGKPVLVIKDGIPMQKAMKQIRFANDDLQEELRKNGIFDISTVGYALVETDGQLSVYLKAEQQPLTPKVSGIPVKDDGMSVVAVSDGVISDFALSLCEKSTEWIDYVLKKENVILKDVYLLTCDKSEKYNLIKKLKE